MNRQNKIAFLLCGTEAGWVVYVSWAVFWEVDVTAADIDVDAVDNRVVDVSTVELKVGAGGLDWVVDVGSVTAERDVDCGAGVVVDDRAVDVAVADIHVDAGFFVNRTIDAAVAIIHVSSGAVVLVDGAIDVSAAGDIEENNISMWDRRKASIDGSQQWPIVKKAKMEERIVRDI